ncbi:MULTISPECIES: isoaspartyl peptidase/L-asparaginase family protein [Chitinophagaceae]
MHFRKYPLLLLTVLSFISYTAFTQNKKYVLVIHGGAGTILKQNMTLQKEEAFKAGLKAALMAGYKDIKAGKTSIDAVQDAIVEMENNPLFNAGKGAVFTHDGRNELDASIMNGKTLEAGAVAGVTTIKNPIKAARAVMEKSKHVMMIGKGAEMFAKEVGLEIVDPQYFWTKERWDGLQKIRKEDATKTQLDHDAKPTTRLGMTNHDYKFGTVGCVALDQQGNLAAGTSTGGMTNKQYGRVGDSPLIGAGTYCDNNTAGISCTGWGEFFIRTVAAKSVCDLIAYKQMPLKEATETVIKQIEKLGGDGGMIALNKNGEIALTFNTAGMYRGAVTEDGNIEIEFYK